METQTRSGTPSRERSLGELFKDLATESSHLVRQELTLARTELRRSTGELKQHITRLAIGGAFAAVGGMVLVAFVVALLGDLLGGEYWLGALIVGLVMVGIGGWLALRAVRAMREVSLAPQKTLTALRTTQTWARAEAAELRASLATGQSGNGAGVGDGTLYDHDIATAGRVPVNRLAPHAGLPAVPASSAGSAPAPDQASAGRQENLVMAVVREIQEDDIMGQAAKVAYYAFLSLPPALMAVFGLAGLFGSFDLAQTIEQEARLVLPDSVMDAIIRPFIHDVVLNEAPGPLSVGLLLALWGASSVFASLMGALNTAYDVEETRSMIRQRAIALGVMIGGALLFLLAAVTLLAGPSLAGALGLGATGDFLWTLLQWPLAFSFMVVAFFTGYYFLPNRDQKACKKELLKAASGAALLWVAATAAFRIYIANFSSYSETYGFLGAFIVLLLWLYVTGLVVLAGGELASEMEKR